MPELNPRSQSVKSMEMSVRRSRALQEALDELFVVHGGSLTALREDNPFVWATIEMFPGFFVEIVAGPKTGHANVDKQLSFALGEWIDTSKHILPDLWPYLVDLWNRGRLREMEEPVLAMLPQENLERIA